MDQPDSTPPRSWRTLRQWINKHLFRRDKPATTSNQRRLSSHTTSTRAAVVPIEATAALGNSPQPTETQIEAVADDAIQNSEMAPNNHATQHQAAPVDAILQSQATPGTVQEQSHTWRISETEIEPAVDSVQENAPEEAVRATNGTQQSPPTGSAPAEPPAGTATQPEHRPITNPVSPPDPRDAAAQPEQSPTPSLWHSKSPPQWSIAVIEWKTKHLDEFVALQKLGIEISESPIDNTDKTFRFQESGETSKQTAARIKRWLPVLSAVRGIAMTAAALDPHKIAPIVCASVFFSIDIVLNGMTPEDRDKTLDFLFECGNTITECISFETNFLKKTHPAIEEDVNKMVAELPAQYVRALRLVYDIQFSLRPSEGESKTEWIKHKSRGIWAKLSNKIFEWEKQANALKRHKTSWATNKKSLDDKLAADEYIVKVLTRMKKDRDPELSLDFIRKTVTSEGRYEEFTPWLFENEDFVKWCNTSPTIANQPASKRVLWIKGAYGTGKTTLLYHIYSALKYRPDFSAPGEVWRIVPYFCNASTGPDSKRPDFETIVRSMCCSLSLLPDFSPAQAALDEYNKSTSAQRTEQGSNQPFTDSWEKLFGTLLSEGPRQYQVVFLVDALDECNLSEAEHLLEFMKGIMVAHPDVRLLCSSHQQVRVPEYMGAEILQEIEVTAKRTEPEMLNYIRGELESRRNAVNDSIFFKPNHTDLLRELEEMLITNAKGMFQWVKVWLAILLPIRDPINTTRLVEDAKKKLKALKDENTYIHDLYQRLEAGYQRLWDMNALAGYESRRTRLFQFVLGSLQPVSTEMLTEVLRIQDGSYTEEVNSRDVELLYANFLRYAPSQGLQFVHDTARKFILNIKLKNAAGEHSEGEQFSEKENHMSIANLYIEIMSHSNHPFWQHLGIDPSNWRDVFLDLQKMDRLQQDFLTWSDRPAQSFILDEKPLHLYLARWGFRHCFNAAQKRSIFDGLWTEVLNSVILSPGSAFGFVILAERHFADLNPERALWIVDASCLLRLHDGRLELLCSHALALLDLIDRDDIARLQLGDSAMEAGSDKDRQRRLFEHVACKGGIEVPENFGQRTPLFAVSRRRRGRTALHIAFQRRNTAAIDMILQAALVLSDLFDVASMLYGSTAISSPLFMAIQDHQFSLAKKLLVWETEYLQEAYEPDKPFVTRQWSVNDREIDRTALSLAIRHFTEDQTRHLLSFAKPDDVNKPDGDSCLGDTPLHIAAAHGYLELVTDLVEKYGADTKAKNFRKETPAFYAFLFYRQNVVQYFEKKEANVKFDADSRPERPPSARDLEEWWMLGSDWTDPKSKARRRRRSCSPDYGEQRRKDLEQEKTLEKEKTLALMRWINRYDGIESDKMSQNWH